MLDEKTASERLVDYFPKWKQLGVYTHTYRHMVQCFCDLINSDDYCLDEKKAALKHASDNFHNMCENDPMCMAERQREELKIQEDNREVNYRKMYENHKKVSGF